MQREFEDLRLVKQEEFDKRHSQEERNKKGQFPTPSSLAQEIVRDLFGRMKRKKVELLEPSCGSGAFISAALSELPTVRVTAVEKDHELCGIARSLWGDVVEQDFFDFADSCNKKFDALVANPPYSRHHHIAQSDKEKYSKVVEKLTGGTKLSTLSGLHAYFILAATSLLKKGGVASWLIPSELFTVNYGELLRKWMTDRVRLERLHFFKAEDLQFDDALVTSCVAVLRNESSKSEDRCVVTTGDFSSPERSFEISVSTLRALKGWQHLPRLMNEDCSFLEKNSQSVGDLFVVKRGIATGGNKFFIRKRTEWESLGVESKWLTPVIPSPRFFKDEEVSNCSAFPLLLTVNGTDTQTKALEDYLNSCPKELRDGFILQKRQKWYCVGNVRPAPIVCTYMSRSKEKPFRFIRNRTHATCTNTYLCLYPRVEMTEEQIDMVCEQLNKIPAESLIIEGREYGGGLCKLEPRELMRVKLQQVV